ncbi:lipopolysaccharide biosynthesis protein [uncultured Sphingomonas sp.]|uniref:lipopolysaccharide biosynthesis protein n=1 Tax=uncultured Sphingomonas sp. TaxID=158754 RepID=UPI0035CC592F
MSPPPADAAPSVPLQSAADRLLAKLMHPEQIEQWAALILRVISAGLGYGILALAARVTESLHAFSDFALVMAATALFGAVATMGQETLLLRRLPVIQADGLVGYRPAILRSARIVTVGLAVFALLAMVYGAASFDRPDLQLIVLTGLLVVGSGSAELFFAIQRGGGHVLGPVFRREIVWKLVLFLAAAGLLLAGRRVGAATLAGWYLVGIVAAVVLSLAAIARVWWRAPGGGAEGAGEQGGAVAFFLLNFIVQAGTQLDVLVLGLAANIPAAQLGAFYAAQRTIQILYILPYGASMTAAPRLPLAWATRDRAEIARLSRQVSRSVALVVAALALAAFVFRDEIMAIFRPEFVPYAALLPILALSPLLSALGGLHGQVASMCGLEGTYARWRFAILIVFLAAKLLVAHEGSLILFACVSATEALAITLAGVLLAWRRLGVRLL